MGAVIVIAVGKGNEECIDLDLLEWATYIQLLIKRRTCCCFTMPKWSCGQSHLLMSPVTHCSSLLTVMLMTYFIGVNRDWSQSRERHDGGEESVSADEKGMRL
jgi:hypothetical protein